MTSNHCDECGKECDDWVSYCDDCIKCDCKFCKDIIHRQVERVRALQNDE